MQERKEEFIARFEQFISGLSQADSIAVLYHADADGLCAAVCALRALKKLNLKPRAVFDRKRPANAFSRERLNGLKEMGIGKIIALDLCVDQDIRGVKQAEKFAELLVLDHHKLYNDLNSKRTLMIKSQFISAAEPSTYPVAKLAFDLFGSVADISSVDWIAAVGIIGDASAKRWKAFIEGVRAKYNLQFADLERLERMIGSVESLHRKKFGALLNEFVGAEGPAKIKRSGFAASIKKFDAVLERAEKKLLKTAKRYPEIGLVLGTVKTRQDIKSALINRLSRGHFPDKTVVLFLDTGKPFVRFSARRQDGKVKVNDLLEASVKGLKGATAGGHAPAAAGMVLRKDLPKFRKNLIAELGKAGTS